MATSTMMLMKIAHDAIGVSDVLELGDVVRALPGLLSAHVEARGRSCVEITIEARNEHESARFRKMIVDAATAWRPIERSSYGVPRTR